MPAPIATHTITMANAGHVLHVTGYDGGLEPGGFTSKLIEAMLHADEGNLERLSRGFEGLVSAVRVYKELPSGVDILRDFAASGHGSPATPF